MRGRESADGKEGKRGAWFPADLLVGSGWTPPPRCAQEQAAWTQGLPGISRNGCFTCRRIAGPHPTLTPMLRASTVLSRFTAGGTEAQRLRTCSEPHNWPRRAGSTQAGLTPSTAPCDAGNTVTMETVAHTSLGSS